MTASYIALGSNLQNPVGQLRRAVAALAAFPDSHLSRVSGVYRSAAVGPGRQPDYLNAVALLETRMAADVLLEHLQQQELEQGRTRGVRWGARTLDLDILLYGDLQRRTPRLTLPHPAMAQRNFVLYPLAELCEPNFVLPDGTELDTLVRDCPLGDLSRTELRLHLNGPE